MTKITIFTFEACLFLTLAFSDVSKPTQDNQSVELRRFDEIIILENNSQTSANISFGDVDGDKDLDIVLAKGRHWPLFNKILLNDGKGNFPDTVNLGTKPDRTYSSVLTDLEADGDLDIVVSNDDPDEKLVYFNNGRGVFNVSKTWGHPLWNTRNATVADLNNDGKPDIIAANRPGPSYFCLNDGSGKFPAEGNRAIPAESASSIFPGDFNNDGFIDLAVPHRDGGQSLLFYNDGKANFTVKNPFGPAVSNARAGAVADLNHDGFMDLLIGDEKAGNFIYLNNKKGGFNTPIAFGEKQIPYSIVTGDLNNDKKIDIVVGYKDSKTTAFFNLGDGVSFSEVKFGDGKGTVYGMSLADINKDGFLDIGVACTAARNIIYISQNDKPNIVLIFPDNIGMGEVNCYGGVRGVPTPNIDKIGQEGIRLTNFNVEYSCTPSRIAMLTGRYAARAGEDYYSGTTLWENTLAEQLKTAGYATALFGKWDLGNDNFLGKREPTHQGFDEWYGIPETSHFSQFTAMKGFPKDQEVPYIWEGITGQTGKKVKPFDLTTRRTIDREAAEKSVNFIQKNAAKKQPFFLYYPMTQLHFPALPHPDKAGTTGAGDMGDAMADVDYNVGLILKALEQSGVDKNTIVIWCSDNGAEMRRPWRGSSGPWRGYYNSAMEGGVRTPCVIRWTGRIKPGQVSNEMVHEVDMFATIAAAAGVPYTPNDRTLDGVNQLPFLEGKQKQSNRESTLFMNRNGGVMAVKWHDWKLWYNFKTEMPDADPDNLVRLFDLRVDPQEEIDVKDHYPWVIGIMDAIVKEYELSLVQYPRVSAQANIADPYVPPPMGSGKLMPTYTRTDRATLEKRSTALLNPDFTGSWSTIELNTVSVINRSDKPKVASLGSGWGDKISIVQRADYLDVERVIFAPRESQPLVNYRYALNGTITENEINMGRSMKPLVSTTTWQENRLVITTTLPWQNPKNGQWQESKMIQTLWLEDATNAPWEPKLVIETYREGVLGGLASTNRTVYSKGYR